MHAVTFQIKRAHLRGVIFGRKAVEKKLPDMTPARFDLLYAIRKDSADALVTRLCGYASRQDLIWKALGLHPSTVSKMIKRLVQLGWLRVERRAPEDERTNVVYMTKDGVRVLQRAMRIIFRQRIHLKHFEDLFKAWRPDVHVLEAIDGFWSTVDHVARRFGDTSDVEYDFGFKSE
jgi:DNA-binding MarR family transcriptional regulator